MRVALIFDLHDGVEIEDRRVEYDVQAAARNVRSSELPDFFANKLGTGGRASVEDPGVVRAGPGGGS